MIGTVLNKQEPMRALFPLLLLVGLSGQAQTNHTITAVDFEFLPLDLTITAGDTVYLNLGPGHGFREITANAWDLNVTTPAIGYDFGPYDVLNTENFIVLTAAPDTLHYICVPHATMGMKGRIFVQEASIGMDDPEARSTRFFPNPTTGTVWLSPAPAGAITARTTDSLGRTSVMRVSPGGRTEAGGLSDGPYHIAFMDGDGKVITQGRLIVQH